MTAIEKLRQACNALFLEVPEAIARDVQAKAEAVIAEAEKDAFHIECLEIGGVDNWEWYDDSLKPYWSEYNADLQS